MVTYRKTRGGEWVAFGPADEVAPGQILVTRRSGGVEREVVARVGKPFMFYGALFVFGYFADDRTSRTRYAGSR